MPQVVRGDRNMIARLLAISSRHFLANIGDVARTRFAPSASHDRPCGELTDCPRGTKTSGSPHGAGASLIVQSSFRRLGAPIQDQPAGALSCAFARFLHHPVVWFCATHSPRKAAPRSVSSPALIIVEELAVLAARIGAPPPAPGMPTSYEDAPATRARPRRSAWASSPACGGVPMAGSP